jgi:hypothetical protein
VVASIKITGVTDTRVAKAIAGTPVPGSHIIAVNIGKMISQILADNPTYYYLGAINTLGNGNGVATLVINQSVMPYEPQRLSTQVVVSTVGVPAMASAGSDAVTVP